ncbi:MAG: hypothetical protein ACI915_003518 [Gammaproteobacteria bacterium]|jgi:hypothetical protein
MWLKWLPWRFVVKHVARAHGFLDPIALQARMQSFLQPSEVAEPIELLRAGAVMHARGLINSRVVQHNLDWIWPYWIERQFDPTDASFVPRAFSITHINLTHRNWTAIGVPDFDELPIVDPRGLLTPFYDGWSIDAWVVKTDGPALIPSRTEDCEQTLEFEGGFTIRTRTSAPGMSLQQRATVILDEDTPACRLTIQATANGPGHLVVALRPYNPEGISFIHDVRLDDERREWLVNGEKRLRFDRPIDAHYVSDYRHGDVHIHLHDLQPQTQGHCAAGMVTAAALFDLEPDMSRTVEIEIPLARSPRSPVPKPLAATAGWRNAMEQHCRLELPDQKVKFLYDTALHTLLLHSPDDVYPGPYTYKRFWFRDAAFMIHALLCAGFPARAERALDRFFARQTSSGYFHSQDGEWDSNGEALWIMWRYCQLTQCVPKPEWHDPIRKAAHWIVNKRTVAGGDELHSGLLPAGFSAEHLGPNDFYFWDDFWGVAGLKAASAMYALTGDVDDGSTFEHEADSFFQCINDKLKHAHTRIGRPAIPASPYRRLDAGVIGSLVASYPLRLYPASDLRILDTAEYLLEHCLVKGAFFQDMIHSGLNAYLTLHLAQALLRAGDPRYLELIDVVANLASSTGQWPEASHPQTLGGCMGDGQHAWAAAEWILMLRNCFVREEENRLILASGVAARWLVPDKPIRFGPAPTPFGSVTIEIERRDNALRVSWQGEWVASAPEIAVRVPGWQTVLAARGVESVVLHSNTPK